jgi:hypothetical protein
LCIRQYETCSALCKQKYGICGNAIQGEIFGVNDAEPNILYIQFKKMCTGRTLETRTTAMSLDYTGKACIMKGEVWSPYSHQ